MRKQATSPNGNPSSYEFDVPIQGGDTTNFFRVNTNGQTTGLVNNFAVDFPAVSPVYNGVTPLGNFAVNPINGSQILISTATGDLYQTTNKGVVADLLPEAAARDIDLGFRIAEEVALQGDPFSLISAMRNLVENAVKFTPNGGSVDLGSRADL